MTKRNTTIALALPAREAGAPASAWLCAQLRTEILEGRLKPGRRLPSTRDIASQHGLSRGTIVSAFDQLKSEGYVVGNVGSGTYVSEVLPDDLLQLRRKPLRHTPPAAAQPRHLSSFAKRTSDFPGFSPTPARAFRIHQPALDLFPAAVWAQVASRRLRGATVNLLLGCGPMGYRPLQEAISDYLSASRGVRCSPEQIAIVPGVQEALDLVGRLLLDPGDRVCMENPGYPGASRVFSALGAKVSGVSVDDEGMQVPNGRLRNVRLAYITPAHQAPLGVCMSLPRRLALLEWARKTGALIFEDDYDSEYRYAGRPVPALQGLDRDGVVLFAGSFSKVLFPSLRLGYLVVPEDLVDSVAAVRSVTSRHVPALEQAVLCDFITGGHFGRHIRRMREVYAERLSVLLDHAGRHLSGSLEIIGVAAGLHTSGWLCGGITGANVAEAAVRHDLEVAPLSWYAEGRPTREGLLLGFAAVDKREIRRGVEDLAVAIDGELRRNRREA